MKHAVCAADELPADGVLPATVDGIAVVIVRTATGELHALRDICPHQGALLSKGSLEAAVDGPSVGVYELSDTRMILRCPWHGYEFDVDTGRCLADASSRVRTYPVTVEDGMVVVER
ncbi:MAG: Rieske (2Fe-2S) protein [Actinomycetota bacterium]